MSRRDKFRGTESETTCQYQDIGGHYDCEQTKLEYQTSTGHKLCLHHALMWLGLMPLHPEDHGHIREIQNRGA